MLVVRSFSAFTGIRFVLWISGSVSFGFTLSPPSVSDFGLLVENSRPRNLNMPQRPWGANGYGWIRMSKWLDGRPGLGEHSTKYFIKLSVPTCKNPMIEVGEESLWTQKSSKWWKGYSISISIGLWCWWIWLSTKATWRGCSENTSFPWPHRIDLARAGEHTSYHHQLWLVNTYSPETRQPTRSWKCMSIWPHPTFRSTLLLDHPSSRGIFSPESYLLVTCAKESEMHSWFDPCRSWLFIKTKQFQTSHVYKS